MARILLGILYIVVVTFLVAIAFCAGKDFYGWVKNKIANRPKKEEKKEVKAE